MKIHPAHFQAAAILHHGLVEHAPLPQDPVHASNAKYMVERLLEGCKGDATLLISAATILCGFMGNKASGHCTPDELVSQAMLALHNVILAFQGPTVAMAVASGPAQTPQTVVPPPVPLPLPSFPEPKTPLEVPDFGQ
jgi:hypothetical protein